MTNAFSFLRRPAAVAAGVLALAAVAATPAAAVECKTKFLVGTWLTTSYDPDVDVDDIEICVAQLNEKGQFMQGACSTYPGGKKDLGLDGHFNVSKSCTVTGRLTFINPRNGKKESIEFKGKLDPKKGVVEAKPFTFYQQW